MLITLYPPVEGMPGKPRLMQYECDEEYTTFVKDTENPQIINTEFIGKISLVHGIQSEQNKKISNVVEITLLDMSKIVAVLTDEDYIWIPSSFNR